MTVIVPRHIDDYYFFYFVMVSCSELKAETKQVLVSFCSCRASEMERQVIVFALLYVRALDLMSCLKSMRKPFSYLLSC